MPWICAENFRRKVREIPVSSAEQPLSDLKTRLFPNPASDILYIRFHLQEAIRGKIEVIATDGKMVRSLPEENWHAGYNLIPVGLESLQPGNYIVRICGSYGTVSQHMAVIQ